MTFRRIIPVLLLLLVLVTASYAEPPKYLEVTFLSTNDLHCKLWNHDVLDATRKTITLKDVGGAARRATIIRKVRAESRGPVFLLDSGDTTYGWSYLGRYFHGKSDIAMMNAIGYDAMAPGNHEFQHHSDELMRNYKDSKFPWLCANMIYEKTGKLFAEPYIIIDRGGIKVAVFGLTNEWPCTQPHIYFSAPELGLKYLDATPVAAKLVPELRKKADVVVLLSHLGRGADEVLAKAVPGIDIILGGHSHSRLTTPRMIPSGAPTAYWTAMVPVVQAWYLGIDMGLTKLIFHRDNSGKYTLMSCKGELIRINSTIPDDPEIREVIQYFQDRMPPPTTPVPPAILPRPAAAAPSPNK